MSIPDTKIGETVTVVAATGNLASIPGFELELFSLEVFLCHSSPTNS